MTREQIDDVAKAGRLAAIGQAVKHGNRCVFAIVVVGLDVGAPLAVQTNATDATPEQVIRILQNGIAGLRNNSSGGKIGGGGGGLITLSVLAIVFGILAAIAAGCGSVEATHGDAQSIGAAGAGGRGDTGAAGGADGAVQSGVAGGAGTAEPDAAGAGGRGGSGGAAAMAGGDSGGAVGAGDAGNAGTAGAGGAGLTGAAGTGAATCAEKVTGAICYQCPAPAPTCGAANRGAWLCCDKAGNPACDPGWCRS